MKIYVFLLIFFVGFTFADVNQELIYPKGCKRKGNLIKCPIRRINAGEIFDLDRNLMYEYYPKSDRQTEMASVSRCRSITPVPSDEWIEYRSKDYKNWTDFMMDVIKARDFILTCEERVPIKEIFCQDDKMRILIVKYDDLGIEDELIRTSTDNPHYCKEKFDKKFK